MWLHTSAGNLFKIIFRASAERVQALQINLLYFSLAGSPDIYSCKQGFLLSPAWSSSKWQTLRCSQLNKGEGVSAEIKEGFRMVEGWNRFEIKRRKKWNKKCCWKRNLKNRDLRIERGAAPRLSLSFTAWQPQWQLLVAGGFSEAARNAIVFTINTACLPAQRGGLIT